ncbi:Putative fatty acyl-CoA reductase CG5065 [Anthophora quadrimaculata]
MHGGNNKMKGSGERPTITAFYAGRSIFVTGGTGFLGKVLIEKLLRSCPDIKEIFLLMRPKKGQSIEERLKQTIELPLFDKLREKKSNVFDKLIPIYGDVSVEGLGLSENDRRTIVERVSIIFHNAANVRFHENLRKDIFSNTRSTRDLCNLAKTMKNLVAFVHVSTAFSQSDKPVIEEIVYPPPADWKDTIAMVESLDEETLQTFSRKYLGTMPNTYTFSKRLAEQVVTDYSKDLPCVLFRPTIVISTIEDPVSGWLDNFNGPVGMLIGGGKGILRIMRLKGDTASDFIPVDLAIKVMITATWKRGLQTIKEDPNVHVYNGSSNQIQRIVQKEMIAMGFRTIEKIPLEGIVWYPRTFLTGSRILHYVLTLLCHLLPALIIDGILKLIGREPMLVKLQKVVYSSTTQLGYFLHNEWLFKNEKMLSILWADLPAAEREIFGYDYSKFNGNKYFHNCVVGAKRYLLKEDLSQLEAAKRHYVRMMWIDRVFNVCAIALTIWILRKMGIFSYFLESTGLVTEKFFLRNE